MGLGEYAKKKFNEHVPVGKILAVGGIALGAVTVYEVGPAAYDTAHYLFVDWDVSGVLDDINHLPGISYLHNLLDGNKDTMDAILGIITPEEILRDGALSTESVQHATLPINPAHPIS